MRLKKIQKINLFLAVVFSILTACANNSLVPVVANGVTTEDGYAVVRTDSLLIAIRPQMWNCTQSNLRPNLYSVLLQVKNTTNRKIQLPSQRFKITSDGIQYDAVPLPYILEIMRKEIMVSQYDDMFTQESTLDFKNNQQQAVSEMINGYFSFGDILPGATKKGYVFFNPKLTKANSIEIDTFDSKYKFSPKSANRYHMSQWSYGFIRQRDR